MSPTVSCISSFSLLLPISTPESNIHLPPLPKPPPPRPFQQLNTLRERCHIHRTIGIPPGVCLKYWIAVLKFKRTIIHYVEATMHFLFSQRRMRSEYNSWLSKEEDCIRCPYIAGDHFRPTAWNATNNGSMQMAALSCFCLYHWRPLNPAQVMCQLG